VNYRENLPDEKSFERGTLNLKVELITAARKRFSVLSACPAIAFGGGGCLCGQKAGLSVRHYNYATAYLAIVVSFNS
jgi:hypothetical protein